MLVYDIDKCGIVFGGLDGGYVVDELEDEICDLEL